MLVKLLLTIFIIITPDSELPNIYGTNQEAHYAAFADETIQVLQDNLGRPITYPELFGMLWHHEVGTIDDINHPFVQGVEEAIAHQFSDYCQPFPCTYGQLTAMLGLGFDAFWMNGTGSIENMLDIYDHPSTYRRAISAGFRIWRRAYQPFYNTDAWSAGPLIFRTHIQQGDRDSRGWYAAWVGRPPNNSFPDHNFIVWNSSGIRLLD